MIYLFYGTDTKKVADALERTLGALKERAPHASIERIDQEAVGDFSVEALLASQGLFHPARIIIFDRLFEDADAKEALLSALKDMAASPHLFLLREEKLLAPLLKKIEKHAEKIARYDAREVAHKAGNPFALADALLRKDKKQLWLTLASELRSGSSPEELHGILFWGAKNLVLAGGSEHESGLHPFVYKKTRTARERFSVRETETLIAVLASLPHEARRSGMPLELALERFALSFPHLRMQRTYA